MTNVMTLDDSSPTGIIGNGMTKFTLICRTSPCRFWCSRFRVTNNSPVIYVGFALMPPAIAF